MRSRSKFPWASCVFAVAATTVLVAASTVGAGPKPAARSPVTAKAVEWARAGAAQKLRNPECQKVLTDFNDGQGHPLQLALEKRGVSPADYVQEITFVDGSPIRSCRLGSWVLLVASPGSPSVGVCPVDGNPFVSRLAQVQARRPAYAEAIIIHEMLHTLGLGENPPTSEEITRQVQLRCGS